MNRSRTRSILLAGLLALALVGLAACNSDASTRAADDSTTTTAAPVKVAAEVPPGTTLRVGDQLDYLKTVLSLAGEDRDFPYDVQYSSFVGGPPMLQAFQAGSLDTGFVGSTPLIFAQAANQSLVAVAGWATERANYGLLVPPGSSISGWKDLKGTRVAYQQGTAGEAALLQALDRAGLQLSDVTPVNIPTTQISATLQGGSADAGVSVEPLISVYLAANPGAKVAAKAGEITDRSSFVIASEEALGDSATTAALGDYITRLVRSFAYLRDHPDQIADAVYVKQYGLTPARAREIVAASGGASFFALPGPVLKPQQRLADLFQQAGEIPKPVTVGNEFDPRFNALVQTTQAKATAGGGS